jgi:hypothetical protein
MPLPLTAEPLATAPVLTPAGLAPLATPAAAPVLAPALVVVPVVAAPLLMPELARPVPELAPLTVPVLTPPLVPALPVIPLARPPQAAIARANAADDHRQWLRADGAVMRADCRTETGAWVVVIATLRAATLERLPARRSSRGESLLLPREPPQLATTPQARTDVTIQLHPCFM